MADTEADDSSDKEVADRERDIIMAVTLEEIELGAAASTD